MGHHSKSLWIISVKGSRYFFLVSGTINFCNCFIVSRKYSNPTFVIVSWCHPKTYGSIIDPGVGDARIRWGNCVLMTIHGSWGLPSPPRARFYINPTLSNQGFHEKGQRTSFAPIKKTSPRVSLPSHEYKTPSTNMSLLFTNTHQILKFFLKK